MSKSNQLHRSANRGFYVESKPCEPFIAVVAECQTCGYQPSRNKKDVKPCDTNNAKEWNRLQDEQFARIERDIEKLMLEDDETQIHNLSITSSLSLETQQSTLRCYNRDEMIFIRHQIDKKEIKGVICPKTKKCFMLNELVDVSLIKWFNKSRVLKFTKYLKRKPVEEKICKIQPKMSSSDVSLYRSPFRSENNDEQKIVLHSSSSRLSIGKAKNESSLSDYASVVASSSPGSLNCVVCVPSTNRSRLGSAKDLFRNIRLRSKSDSSPELAPRLQQKLNQSAGVSRFATNITPPLKKLSIEPCVQQQSSRWNKKR
ncbi:hypothetical protein Ddc_07051 [Ditylenchus destructor]|nr:hypothetical protein Ddc_07051 [Ditylenchus destructor]